MVGGLIALVALIGKAHAQAAWTESEREVLTHAPAVLADPDVRWVKRPAGPLGEAPRLSVRVSGDRIEIGADGLDARVAAWADTHPAPPELGRALLERAVVEGLAARIDHHRRLSDTREWRALSDWARGRPGEQDPLGFADRRGRSSAADDFATVVGVTWGPALPGDPPMAPACRMPSKVAWAADALGIAPPPGCPSLADGPLAPDRVDHIDLVFVAASSRNPASLAGHVAVRIDARGSRGPTQATYTLAAETGDARGLGFLWGGVVGRWPAMVSEMPYRAFATQYADAQDRDLHRYRLVLTPAQEQAALERLRELELGWRRPYLFFTRNCTELPLELARAITRDDPVHLPPLFGADALLADLDRRGMLVIADDVDLREHSLSARAAAADRARRRIAHDLPQPARDAAADALHERRADAGLLALAAAVPALDPPTLAAVDRFLALSEPVARYDGSGTDAVRAARAATRAAGAPGVDLGPLLAELLPAPPDGSRHTPLGRVAVGSVWTAGRPAPDGVARWALYDGELGVARRYPLAPGLAFSLLRTELRAPHWRARGTLGTLRQVRGERPWLNLGLYGVAGRYDGSADGLAATWLELGPSLELWQHAAHRQSVWVAAGAAVGSRFGTDPAAFVPSLPVSAGVHLAGARSALTSIDLEGRWTPSAPSATARARHVLWTGAIDGGLELVGAFGSSERELGASLVLEPR